MRTDVVERSRMEQTLRSALQDRSPATGPASPGTARLRGVRSCRPRSNRSSRLDGRTGRRRGTRPPGGCQRIGIPPDVFIPIAEETGHVGALDMRLLDLACRQLARWRADTPDMAGVSMSVNISSLHVRHSSLADDIHRALNRISSRRATWCSN